MAEGVLKRSTKEKIATFVSEKNACSICITAHGMIKQAANRAEDKCEDPLYNDALLYAEAVHKATTTGTNVFYLTTLSEEAKAEVALTVLVVMHMNRSISSLIGEEMTTAMFSVPRPVAKRMESPKVMKVMNKVMSPFLSGKIKSEHKPGFTDSLFRDQKSTEFKLPDHLQGVTLAGEHRARALARMNSLVESTYKSRIKDFVSENVVAFLKDAANTPPPNTAAHSLSNWVLIKMQHKVKCLCDRTSEGVAIVLLLVKYSPKSVFRAISFTEMEQRIGKKEARLVVLWWSMVVTLENAKGF